MTRIGQQALPRIDLHPRDTAQQDDRDADLQEPLHHFDFPCQLDRLAVVPFEELAALAHHGLRGRVGQQHDLRL